jgi:plastocyanin
MSSIVRQTKAVVGLCMAFMLATCILVGTVGCNKPVDAGPRAQDKVVEEIRTVLAAGAAEGGDEEEAAAAGPTGWATLKGKFKVVGAAPSPGGPLAIAKQNADCSLHDVFDESVVVKDGNLVGAVIYARTPKMAVRDDVEAPTEDIVLDNVKCRFEPHVVFVQAGQTLKVKNSDPFGHNTKIDSKANLAENFTLPGGEVIEQTFAKEEPQPVKVGCSIHPWMGAWLVVRGNPYGAVSDDKGEFVIANLPAGQEIEFQLWQEKAQALKSAQGEQIKVDSKGRFKLKLEPDQEMVLEIGVPADALR